MSLVAEIIGVLVAGTAIALFLGRSQSAPIGRAVGVALTVVAVSSVLFLQNGWSTISAFPGAARADQAISKTAAETAAGAPMDVGFLAWVRDQMAAAHRQTGFMLVPEAIRTNAFDNQWSTYQLLPAFETDDPQRADWIVFYDVNPRVVPYDRGRFTRLIVYRAGFALAERTRGG